MPTNPPPPTWPAVEVWWHDAQAVAGWEEWDADDRHRPALVRSVGMMAKKDESGVSLILSAASHDSASRQPDVNGVLFIPAAWIVKGPKRLA